MTRLDLPAPARRLLAAIVLLPAAAAAAGANVVREDATIKSAGLPDVRATVFTVDPARARIRVLTAQDVKYGPSDHHGVSVREAADTPLVGRVITRHTLLFNGGFSAADTDVPAGLLVSDGAIVSLASYATKRADPASACALRRVERPRLSGVFCVAPSGAVSIEGLDKTNFDRCQQAVQAGPMLVERPGEPGVCDGATESAIRTAVCLRGQQLLVVVTAAPITLHSLATWLAAPAGANGLGCERALNLSGDTSSGAVYFPGGLASIKNRFKAGLGTYPVPSLILVQSNTIP